MTEFEQDELYTKCIDLFFRHPASTSPGRGPSSVDEFEQDELYTKCIICCAFLGSPYSRSPPRLRRCDDCWSNLDKQFVQYTSIPVEEWDRNAAP